jgi:hypothetical protein
VHVLADGTSSSRQADRLLALQRFSQAGAYVTTSESALFQLMQSAEHPSFKVRILTLPTTTTTLCSTSSPEADRDDVHAIRLSRRWSRKSDPTLASLVSNNNPTLLAHES